MITSNHPAVVARQNLVEAAEALNTAVFRAFMYYAAHARHGWLVAMTGPSLDRFVKHAEFVDAVYNNPPLCDERPISG